MILVVGLVVLLVGVEGFLVCLFICLFQFFWFVYLLIWVFWFVLFCSIKGLSIQSSKI